MEYLLCATSELDAVTVISFNIFGVVRDALPDAWLFVDIVFSDCKEDNLEI